MWINKFKIALASKNIDALDKLINDIPKFKDNDDIKQAMYLLKEAKELIQTLKDTTSSSMKQIKKNINFLKVTQSQSLSKLDIRS